MNTDIRELVAMLPVGVVYPTPMRSEIEAVLREMQGELIEARCRHAMDQGTEARFV